MANSSAQELYQLFSQLTFSETHGNPEEDLLEEQLYEVVEQHLHQGASLALTQALELCTAPAEREELLSLLEYCAESGPS